MTGIRSEILRYSRSNGEEAVRYREIVCGCGHADFRLYCDDTEGAAVRICARCESEHFVADSADVLEEVEVLDLATCPCGRQELRLHVGLAVDEERDEVRWIYLACGCPSCGIEGVYADWSMEGGPIDSLLASV